MPRKRFRPVKSTNELLLVQSDIFDLDADANLVSRITHPEPAISLGKPYKFVPDYLARFPQGVPGMRECTSLTVDADATFGADVTCVGDVTISGAPRVIPDGATLTGTL